MNVIIYIKFIIQHPKKLKQLINMEFFKMPFFLALLPVIYKITLIVLKKLLPNNLQTITLALSGGFSGLAMIFWPNINVALYILWKAIEIYSTKIFNKTNFKYTDIILYTLSSGYVIGTAVLEPDALRKNYYKFLCNLTGNRLQLFNRDLLARNFGFDNSRIYKKKF